MAAKLPLIHLKAGRTETAYWHDIWRYRELFWILAWRDIAVQYKQAVFGLLWAVLRPALTAAIFTVVFGRIAGLPAEGGVPYPLLVMAGMLPWFLISTVLGNGANSLVANGNLISKVYFPRLIVPVASGMVALVDFLLSLLMLFTLMAWYRFVPSWHIVLLPGFMLLAVLAALGPALILSALNIRYRDVRFVVPFMVQFGLYISPVGFSSAVVPEPWKLLYALNPAVAVIDGFRWCLLGGQTQLEMASLALGLAVSLILLVAGLRLFRATEKTFADLL